MNKLQKIEAFVKSHGNVAFILGDKVSIHLPFTVTEQDGSIRKGVDIEFVDTFADAKAALGY